MSSRSSKGSVSTHAVAAKSWSKMSKAQLAAATQDLDKEISFQDTRPLSPKMASAWDRAKRGRGRRRIGAGAEKVLISMEKRLLLVTDALARRQGLDRSKLIARAIREMIEREASAADSSARAGAPRDR